MNDLRTNHGFLVRSVGITALAAAMLSGCAGASSQGPPGDDLFGPGLNRSAVPPIPSHIGDLSLQVEYPDSFQVVAPDSNFIFGTTGTGDAALIIDGQFTRVEANGTFLAWLPVPERTAGDTAWYRLIASRGDELDTLSFPFLRPPLEFNGDGAEVWIDSTALPGAEERWALPDEEIVLRARVSPGGEAWIQAGRARIDMTRGVSPEDREVRIAAGLLHAAACRPRRRCEWTEKADSLPLTLVVRQGDESAQHPFPIWLRILEPGSLPVVELQQDPSPVHGADGVVVGRPIAFGPYRWRFPNGMRAVVDGRSGSRLRLRVGAGLSAWVREEDAAVLPAGTPPPAAMVGDLAFRDRGGRTVLDIPLAAAVPVFVEEPDPYTLRLALFGARGNTNRIALGPGNQRIETAGWSQEPGGRYVLSVRMKRPVWGYRVSYLPRAVGSVLRLEINRTPWVDPAQPLAGRRIAIDPGHPGAGAHGPGGTYEGDVNLAIAFALDSLLREAGAEPVVVRTDTLPLGLYHRTNRAIEEEAELFISIHNNALPDGVRPFGREGTSTYFYHPHASALARHVQQGLLASMGLRDLGVFWGDLAVARMSWMPSVLAEGAFMMMPAHEAALQQPGFQAAYARGVLLGIRAFLAELAAGAE
ncbi:MAG: N-acetylmuramoyl-L-alanine amidase [Gemmatimonadota bacterium]